MSSQKRESKSPIKSIMGLFKKEEKPKIDGPTECILPPEKKITYNPKTKRYEWEGQEAISEEVAKPPPKKSEITQQQQQQQSIQKAQQNDQQDYLKPQNTQYLRARQTKQSKDTLHQQSAILENTQKTNTQHIEESKQQPQPVKEQEKQIITTSAEVSLKSSNVPLQHPQPYIQALPSITLQQQQEQKNLIQQCHQKEKENQVLKQQLMDLCKAYNQLVTNYDSCNNFIQTLPQKLIPSNLIPHFQTNFDLIKIQQPENIHLEKQSINLNIIKGSSLVTVLPQIIDFPLGSNEYLTQIIQEQGEELSDMVELIDQQSQELQNKDIQLQQQQLLLTDLLRKLEEFVNCTNGMKRQLEGQMEERKNYQQYIKQLDGGLKQQDMQIKNLQKEKEVYKRQVQNLQRDKEMYIRYNEELRRQYDEDIQMMNSQLEQSQLLVNDQENTELRQIKEGLQFDLEYQKTETQNLKQLIHDISSEIIAGFRFLASFDVRPIETKLDIQTLCHQYRREFQKQILQKDQGHLQNIQDYKTQIFQIHLQKSSLESIVAQQEKQINNYINDFVQAKKEIVLVCQEYDEKIQEVNEYKQIVINELKQCEDQLFQTNIQLITQQQDIQQQQRKSVLEQNEKLSELETQLISTKRELEFVNKLSSEKDKDYEKTAQLVKDLQEQICKLEQEKKTIEHQVMNQERLIELEKKRLEQLKINSENNVNELSKQNDELSEQLNQLITQYENSQAELYECQQKIDQQTAFLQEMEQNKLEEQQQQESLISQLQDQISQNQYEKEEIQNTLNEHEIKLQQLISENSILSSQNNLKEQSIIESNSRIAELESTQEQLEKIISQLNDQFSNEDQTQTENKIQQLEDQINNKEEELNQKNNELSELSQQIQRLKQEIDNEKNLMTQQFATERSQKDQLIETLEQELLQLTNQLRNSQVQKEELEQNLQQQQNEGSLQVSLKNKYESEIAHLKESLTMFESEKSTLQNQLSLAENQYQSLLQQHKTLLEEIENNQLQQRMSSNQNVVNNEELERLERENLELTEQMSRLVEEMKVVDNERQQNEETRRQYELAVNTIAELKSKEYDQTKLRQNSNQLQPLQEELNNFKQLYAQKLKLMEQQTKQIQDLDQKLQQATQKENLEIQLYKDQVQQIKLEKVQLEQQLERVKMNPPKVDETGQSKSILQEYQNYKTQTQEFMVEQNQKVQKMEQEIASLNSKILQIAAQRDEFKEQVEFKQKNNQPPKASGFVGKLAGFFATESELKKMAQG